MFDFLANLTNYKPKSFKGKTVKEILAMKSSSVGADFFDPANDKAIAEAGLMTEQLDAIEMLRDLKDKTKIFERCYKNKTQRRKMASPKPAVPTEPAEAKPAEAEPAEAEPAEAEPAEVKALGAPVEEESMAGGGRRSRKHKHSRHKHSRHKHSRHKHSRHKHSSRKHKNSRHKHKHSKKRNYKGGDDTSVFKTDTPVVKPMTFSPPPYKPVQ